MVLFSDLETGQHLTSHLKGPPRGATKWMVSMREGWGKGTISKKKGKDYLRPRHFWSGRGNGVYHTAGLLPLWSWRGEWKGPMWPMMSLVLTRKFQTWLIKITFLGEVETANRRAIKSRPDILLGCDALLGLWFFSVIPVNFIIILIWSMQKPRCRKVKQND